MMKKTCGKCVYWNKRGAYANETVVIGQCYAPIPILCMPVVRAPWDVHENYDATDCPSFKRAIESR